jgi:hypothetical protein
MNARIAQINAVRGYSRPTFSSAIRSRPAEVGRIGICDGANASEEPNLARTDRGQIVVICEYFSYSNGPPSAVFARHPLSQTKSAKISSKSRLGDLVQGLRSMAN